MSLTHLRMETGPVSETLCFLVSRIPDAGQTPETQWFWVLFTAVRTLHILSLRVLTKCRGRCRYDSSAPEPCTHCARLQNVQAVLELLLYLCVQALYLNPVVISQLNEHTLPLSLRTSQKVTIDKSASCNMHLTAREVFFRGQFYKIHILW
jgi:hypothetical protein